MKTPPWSREPDGSVELTEEARALVAEASFARTLTPARRRRLAHALGRRLVQPARRSARRRLVAIAISAKLLGSTLALAALGGAVWVAIRPPALAPAPPRSAGPEAGRRSVTPARRAPHVPFDPVVGSTARGALALGEDAPPPVEAPPVAAPPRAATPRADRRAPRKPPRAAPTHASVDRPTAEGVRPPRASAAAPPPPPPAPATPPPPASPPAAPGRPTAYRGGPAPSRAGVSATPPAAPPVAAPAPLLAELEALRRAHAAIEARAPARALAEIERLAASHPLGQLGAEREAVRVLALCALGRAREAEVAHRELARRWPLSPLRHRVRGSCDGAIGNPRPAGQ